MHINIGVHRSQSRTCIFLSCCQSSWDSIPCWPRSLPYSQTSLPLSFRDPDVLEYSYVQPCFDSKWVLEVRLDSVVHMVLALTAKRWKGERVRPLPPQVQKATEAQAEWGKAVFAWRPLEFVLGNWESEAWHILQEELHAGSGPSPGGLSLAASKAGWEELSKCFETKV